MSSSTGSPGFSAAAPPWRSAWQIIRRKKPAALRAGRSTDTPCARYWTGKTNWKAHSENGAGHPRSAPSLMRAAGGRPRGRHETALSWPPAAEYERQHEQGDENEEQDLGNARGHPGYTEKAQDAGDQRNNEQNDRIIQHRCPPESGIACVGVNREDGLTGPAMDDYFPASWPTMPPTAAPPIVPAALPPVRTAPPTAPIPAPAAVLLPCCDIPPQAPRLSNIPAMVTWLAIIFSFLMIRPPCC